MNTSPAPTDSDPAAHVLEGLPSSSTLSSLCSSVLPSSTNSFAPPLIPILHPKPAVRKYGRKTQPDPEPSSDASVVSPPVLPLPAPALVRHSTSAIPETDGLVEDHGMQVDDGDLGSDSVTEQEGSRSSSPTRRCEQTDPTTEEEDAESRGEKDASPSSPSPLPGAESESSDGEVEGALAYVKQNKSVLEALADLDREADEAEARGEYLFSALATSKPLVASSSLTTLPPLTSSALPTTRLADSSHQEPTHAVPTLANASSPDLQAIDDFLPRLDASTSDADDEEDEAVVSRPRATAAMKGKKPRRVVDSDEEEEEAVEEVVLPSDSIDSDEEMLPVPVLSKREKMEALAKKKRPVVVERERSRSVVSEESDAGRKVKAKVSRKGNRMSRKEEEEMNQQTAAMKRNMPVNLQPRVKSSFSIASALSKAPAPHKPPRRSTASFQPMTSYQPSHLPTSDATLPSRARPTLPLSSSSSIIITDSPARPSLSDRAMGKQRATSPIDATPVQRKRGQFAMLVEEEEEEEDLPTIGEAIARNEEMERKAGLAKEEARKRTAFLESKKAALARAVQDDDDDDSDSDIEIQGAPTTSRKARAASVELEQASKTPRLGRSARKMQKLAGPTYGIEEEEPSESQIVASAKTFGNQFADPQLFLSKSSKGRPKVLEAPTAEQLDLTLWEKSMRKNHELRTSKASKQRREQEAKLDRDAVERVEVMDPKRVLADKAARLKEVRESGGEVEDEDEDAEDDDFVLEEERGSDEERGSGMEGEARGEERESASEQEVDVQAEIEEDDDEDEPIPVGKRVAGRAKIVVDDEEEDESTLPPIVEGPVRVQLPAFLDDGDDGGFSQFFGTAFSQDVGAKNDVEGFFRAPEPSAFAPEPTFLGAVLINSAERAKDAERLEAGNAFMNEPATPREMEPPRQYINKKGFMTQTRPANLFEDSPSDSPGESLLHSQSIPGSASVRMTQTQLDATQTPTQAPRGLARRPPLEMLESFIMPGTEVHISTAETEEEVEETQEQDVEEELEEEETEMSGDDLPSAGQHLPATQAATPVRTAFDVLQATQKALAAPPKAKKERARSDFVDAEAVRSDDEDMGMGAGSGDEDENGMDAELESLVDNEEVERDLLEKQDERAGEAYMADRAKDDAETEARIKSVADGKQREKRAGGLDLSDDEFDDDDPWGKSKNRANKKVKLNASIADLLGEEETQSFARAHGEGSSVPIKDGEMDFLMIADDDGEERSDEDEEEGDGMAEDESEPPRAVMSRREADRLAVAESRRRRELGVIRVASPESYDQGDDSSPAPLIKIKTYERRTVSTTTITTTVDEFGFSSHTLLGQHKQNSNPNRYKSDSKEESQGNGTSLGANSSVTGYTKARTGAKAAHGGTLGGGANGKVAVTSAKDSKMSFRRNKFT